MEWDFSDSGSEPGTPQRVPSPPGTLLSSRKRDSRIQRSSSISFAEEDEIVELPPVSLRPKAPLLKQMSRTSFDWDFSDESPGPPVSPSPGLRSNGGSAKRIFFVGEDQLPSTPVAPPRSQSPTKFISRDHVQEEHSRFPSQFTPLRKFARSMPDGLNNLHFKQAMPDPELRTDCRTPDSQPSEQERLIDEKTMPKNGQLRKEVRDDNGTSKEASQLEPFFSPTEGNGRQSDTLSLSSLKRVASRTSLISTMDNVKEKLTIALPDRLRRQADSKLRFFVAFLFLVVVFFIAAAHVVYYKHIGELRLFGHLKLEEAHRRLYLYDQKDSLVIESLLGVTFPHEIHPYPCKGSEEGFNHKVQEYGTKCVEWKNVARLEIEHTQANGVNCYKFMWQSLNPGISPMDCFPLGEEFGHWYGGGESLSAKWPLEKGHIGLSAFVTGDEGQTEWGNIIRKYFLNSRGVSVSIQDQTPLFVSLNEANYPGLCIQAKFDDYAYFYHRFDLPRLNYTVCLDTNVKELHSKFQPKSFWDGHNQRDLDTLHQLMRIPIWQVPFGEGFSYDLLREYVERIVGRIPNDGDSVPDREYERGYLILDYRWQAKMGDLSFNKKLFPDVNQTMDLLRSHGLKLVLTINPFISTDSSNFKVAVKEDLFVKERSSLTHVPALTWFKDVPSAGMLDITNNRTVAWLTKKLKNLVTKWGDDTLFYIDAANTFHTPTYFQFSVPLANPDLYSEEFVKQVMDVVPVIGVSSASSRRPKAPAFLFMTPLVSNWTNLRSIIPNVLQLSVIGYPFINPGPVGGIPELYMDQSTTAMTTSTTTSSWTTDSTEPPETAGDKELELYVRWWQLNTFLPMMHFLRPPSYFPTEKIAPVSKRLTRLRQLVQPFLQRFANEAMSSSAPMIRPLWMINANDSVAQTIDDEFLVGDQILVAPVLEFGQRQRDVYLPNDEENREIVWREGGKKKRFFKGGRWLNNTKVDLNEILFFIRQNSDRLPGIGL